MKSFFCLLGLVFLSLIFLSTANAAQVNSFDSANVTVYYFYGIGCSHCANVEASGVLEKVAKIPGVALEKYEVRANESFYTSIRQRLNIPVGWPLAVIEKGGNFSYLQGDTPIIEKLEKVVTGNSSSIAQKLTLSQRINLYFDQKLRQNIDSSGKLKPAGWIFLIILGAIDSVNPCAFGVLIFLMVTLLSMGSSKRALKAGLLYSFVVFLVYFLSGLGIFTAIQSVGSIGHYVYLGVGLLAVALGLIQFIDVIFPGKFISLRIPPSAKPAIENFARKGTIPAIIILGILVSLFELPCTGGAYLTILTIMAKEKIFALSYLVVYNLIFILPLIIITLIIYMGIKPEKIQNWTSKERKWMKIASGLVMLALGIYILLTL
jgi:cytochrome c biogenesis protein CcdA